MAYSLCGTHDAYLLPLLVVLAVAVALVVLGFTERNTRDLVKLLALEQHH